MFNIHFDRGPRSAAHTTPSILCGALLLSLTGFVLAADFDTAAKKYPPYPDVWGYRSDRGISTLCKAENGEYYVVPSGYYQDTPKTVIVGLFSGSKIELPPKEAEAVEREGKPLDGIGRVKCNRSYNFAKSLTLSNGNSIKRACIGGSCQHPFGIGVEAHDKNQNTIARKVFLLMTEKPEKIYVPRPVAEGGGFSIDGWVRSLNPYFVPLEDNSFLVFAGAIIRFDTHLNTKFPINREHVFVIDTDLVEQVYRKASEKVPTNDVAWNQLVQKMTAALLDKIKQEKNR